MPYLTGSVTADDDRSVGLENRVGYARPNSVCQCGAITLPTADRIHV